MEKIELANLISALRSGLVEIEFIKLDGTIRKIYGTWQGVDLIGDEPNNRQNLNVWCPTEDGWRSFRLGNIVSWNAVGSSI